MNHLKVLFSLCGGLALLAAAPAGAAALQTLPWHFQSLVSHLPASGPYGPSNRMELALSLPLRNPIELSNLLEQMYDPLSTNFHRYLTPEQFAARFGPTAADYEAVQAFARSNRLTVARTYGNRLVVDVAGVVPDVERTFHIRLHTYRHPTENRDFFAPDTEPSVDLAVPLLAVDGLSDFERPHPLSEIQPAPEISGAAGGSGPSSSYRGLDFRNAYVPGAGLDGAGQMVGLLEFDGFYSGDITTYETQAGLPNLPIQIVPVDGFNTVPSSNSNSVGEVSLDIEMAISMATNLSKLLVFEAPGASTTANWVDMLNLMASSNQIGQFSSSWGITTSLSSGDQVLQTMAAEGQSFFQASGDGGAYITTVPWPGDSPYVTSVGGTTLSMSNSGALYLSETVWNTGYITGNTWYGNGASGYWASGGGVSTTYSIPSWQERVNVGAVGGSSSKRNLPDVALTASQIWVSYFNGRAGYFIGTSCAAPLWAGFTALANEKCQADGRPRVGFINPALYSIGLAGGAPFHDITTGNSAWSTNNFYYASSGYDLCTGWGSPSTSLIGALENYAGVVWVDFSVAGPGAGTYDNPYNTLALGIANVAANGTVAIKGPNSTPAALTISKPLILNASGGPVTIGH